MAQEKYRSRVHFILLYPDDATHVEALETIKQSYDFACILHDKDVDENGEIKKAHWHVVLRFQQATWSSAICKNLGIDHRYIEDVKKFDNAMLYLIHYNDDNKVQYDATEVFGNLAPRLVEIINKGEKTEGEKVIEMLKYIEDKGGYVTVTEFAKYCAFNGYWAEFRRAGAIVCKIIEENNKRYEREEEQ